MPITLNRIPSYRKHKPSGQAVVTLDGRDYYLGPYGTAASNREYDRLVGEWQANGRRVHDHDAITVTEQQPRIGRRSGMTPWVSPKGTTHELFRRPAPLFRRAG